MLDTIMIMFTATCTPEYDSNKYKIHNLVTDAHVNIVSMFAVYR